MHFPTKGGQLLELWYDCSTVLKPIFLLDLKIATTQKSAKSFWIFFQQNNKNNVIAY